MDKTDSSVEDFLSQLSQEGRFFESSSFTIDSLKAREKLSQFQMADSGLWLVKLVQAAVAAGAPSVRVQFEKRRNLFHLHQIQQLQKTHEHSLVL